MWIEILFIWIEDVFELLVEMSQSGSLCQQTFFCLFEVLQYHHHHHH